MPNKKVLICGASGFIGRNLFEHLSKRNDLEVYGTYRTRRFTDNPNLLQAELTKKEDVDRVVKGMDVVIQVAASTSGAKDIVSKPYFHVTDNVIMNALIQQSAYDHEVGQFIFTSCTNVYPVVDRPLKETDLDLNGGVYERYFGGGWMKVYIEKLCEFYSRLGKTRETVIRHSNIYGPYDKYDLEKSHVFGATITKVITADDKVVVWGEGKEKRDLLHVSDMVSFVEMVIDKQDYDFDVFNLGLGDAISISDLVKKIIDISGRELSVEYDTSQPSIPISYELDISKVKGKFGWEAKVGLDEGIQKTIEWYKENV